MIELSKVDNNDWVEISIRITERDARIGWADYEVVFRKRL